MSTLTLADMVAAMKKVSAAPERPAMLLLGRKEAKEAIEADDLDTCTDMLSGIPCKFVDMDSCCIPLYKSDLSSACAPVPRVDYTRGDA